MIERIFRTPLESATGFPAEGAVGTLERLPKWLNLVPIVCQWMWLSLRYRSISLPSCANPALTTGGMVGEGKMEYLAIMGTRASKATATTTCITAYGSKSVGAVESAMATHGLTYPVVLKPDIGWCGYGVCKIDDRMGLDKYLAAFPLGETLVIQRWIDQPGEAGIFYMRRPGQATGVVIGMLLRHFPRVTGDGVHSVAELMQADARARRLGRDGASRSCANPHRVAKAGEVVRIATVGSTRVGGLYEDGSALVTPELACAIDAIARDMTQFHAGRFDVKFTDLAALRSGTLTIIEVNGAGSEAVHAWDPSLTLAQAYRIIFDKQRRLFALSAAMRNRGHRPVGCVSLARHYVRQQKLISRYPPSN